jgi:nucleotide-binding universal stress UspA family protein
MKHIVLPVDLKQVPEVAFKFAAQLSALEPTQITLLHIVEFPVVPINYLQPMDYMGEIYASTLTQHQEQLDALAQHPLLQGLVVKTHQVAGALRGPGEEIAAYADTAQADLVVVHSKHRKGLNQLFAGSELPRIVRFCRRPLLVLSTDHPLQLNRMVFATDFSEMSAKVYAEVKQIADWLKVRLMLFHVNTLADFASQRQFAQRRNAFLQMIGPAEGNEVDCYNDWGLESGIANYAEDNAADLIVMATHGRKGLGHLFYGSLTENLVQNTTFPMLILNMSGQ